MATKDMTTLETIIRLRTLAESADRNVSALEKLAAKTAVDFILDHSLTEVKPNTPTALVWESRDKTIRVTRSADLRTAYYFWSRIDVESEWRHPTPYRWRIDAMKTVRECLSVRRRIRATFS
jgi:hypothetical protein